MPDKKQGYVKRKQGIKNRDEGMARNYRASQKESMVYFTPEQQQEIAATLHIACEHLDAVVHCIAIEPTHIHFIISWKHERIWDSIQRSVKSAISRRLNRSYGQRTWLVKDGSHKQVNDQDHFCFLIREYLPSHRGLFWLRDEDRRRFGD
ncbi:MAG: transposase [Planctomycetota bacterium]